MGTGIGGARPKAVVENDEGLWLAKFPATTTSSTFHAESRRRCCWPRKPGISTVESKLTPIGDRSVLLVKRFDREKTEAGYLRHRMISALTVLQASKSATDTSRPPPG